MSHPDVGLSWQCRTDLKQKAEKELLDNNNAVTLDPRELLELLRGYDNYEDLVHERQRLQDRVAQLRFELKNAEFENRELRFELEEATGYDATDLEAEEEDEIEAEDE